MKNSNFRFDFDFHTLEISNTTSKLLRYEQKSIEDTFSVDEDQTENNKNSTES